MSAACANAGTPEIQTPESVGLSSNEIAGVLETVHQRRIPLDSLYIERNGTPVIDLYVYPFAPNLRHDIASVSKSITALTAGTLFADRPGYGMDQLLQPGGTLRLGDALSMRSGLACGDRPGEPELFAMMATANWMRSADDLRRTSPADTVFSYCSPAYLMASAYIGQITRSTLAEQANRLIFQPLGVTDWQWPTDPQGNTRGWGDLDLRAGDLVKIGQLLLAGGDYQGHQIVPAGWVSTATTRRSDASSSDGYGYGFWLRKSVPGLIEGRGRGGQALIVQPSEQIVIVMTASDTDGGQTLPLLAGLKPKSGALAPDPAGVARLNRAIDRLAEPPSPRASGAPGHRAARYLNQSLELADQTWIRTLKLSQKGDAGSLLIDSPYFSFESPLGFDGIPRLGAHGPEDGAVAGVASWISSDHLIIEVRPYALAQRVTLDMVFGKDRVRIAAREASGLFAFKTTARLASGE